MEILKGINSVQAALCKEGIAKSRKNQQQGYSFRGIDDMYNELSPLLAENGVVILPSYSELTVTERENKNGTILFYTRIKGVFTFRSVKDASEVHASTYGEAMDSGDKSTNKAMSAALKYALMQTFTIPTEGDNDSENQTHEVRGPTGKAIAAVQAEKPTSLPATRIAELNTLLTKCASADDLAKLWQSLSAEEQKVCAKLKDSLKTKLAKAA
jgi:hypothetical protein